MHVELTGPQSDIYSTQAEYCAGVAGFGAGKTQAAAIRILAKKLEYPTVDQAYLAPTYALIKSIFYPRIVEVLVGAGFVPRKDFTINKTDHEVLIQGYGKIYCRTMDDPDMIVGWECGDAVMDEFDLLPTDKALVAMDKVSARCRQKYPDGKINQKIITTTPEGYKATYQLFKKKPLPNSQLVQMSTYSNEQNLPPGYIESRVSQYTDQLVQAYILGEFVNLRSGAVYPSYDKEENDTKYTARPREQLYIGMDFNVYHMCAIVHVIRKGIPYAVDEIIDEDDTPSMITTIKEKYNGHPIIVYPDASGANASSKGASISDIRMLKAAGFYVDAPSKNPFIKDRVNSMNAKFCNGQGDRTYFVNSERCPVYSMGLSQQAYDKNGMPSKEGNIDHAPDAGGYFINRKFPLIGSFGEVHEGQDFADELDYSV